MVTGLAGGRFEVVVVQTDPVWENPAANKADLEGRIARACEGRNVDLILLPEMFSTGFSMNAPQLAETMDGPTIAWMGRMAERHQALLTGSLIIRDGEVWFNRAVCAFPDGSLQTYDKHHLFACGGETAVYSPGGHRLELIWRGFHIRLAICYDLRFPEWLRNDSGYDLLLVMASWPSVRHSAWETLLAARAIENQCYVAAANRTGREDRTGGLEYSGGSAILDWTGQALWSGGASPGSGTAILKRQDLLNARASFPVLQDMDRPGIF